MDIGKVIHYHRKKSGLSRNQLALLAGVGKTAIFDVEHGRETIRFDTLLKLFKVLNIKIRFESPYMEQLERLSDEEG